MPKVREVDVNEEKLAELLATQVDYAITHPAIKRRVKALKKLQLECLKSEVEFYKELHALEAKYNDSYQSLYQKRAAIVNGTVEPTDEECDFPSDDEKEDSDAEDEGRNADGVADGGDTEMKSADKKLDGTGEAVEVSMDKDDANALPKDVKGIPEFWLSIFKSIAIFRRNIAPEDEPILKHLTDIQIRMEKEPRGFFLDFYFSPNEYFNNTVLTKHYTLRDSLPDEDVFMYEGTEIVACKGCKIEWKKGKDVTVKTVVRKQVHKSKGTVRTVSKQVQAESFFNFFNPAEMKADVADEAMQDIIEEDFEMGEILKVRVIPRAVLFFTGDCVLDEDFEYDDDEEDEDDDEDDDSDEDDDDDDDKPAGGSAKKGGKGGKQNPEECKQQ